MGSSSPLPPPELPEPPEVPEDPQPFIEEARMDEQRRERGSRMRLRIPKFGASGGSGMNYGG